MFFSVSDNIANSLISYFKFNDNLLDSLGVNNATGSNIGYINGEILKAVGFKGSSSAEVILADSDTLSFVNQSFSFVTFLRIDQIDNNPRIIEKRSATNDEYRALFSTGNVFRTVLFDQSLGGVLRTDSTETIIVDNWYVVTTTFDHTTNTLKLYVDNNDSNTVNNTGTFETMRNFTDNVTIGKDATNVSNSFNGLINAIGIFNKALTPTEVAFVVNKLKVDKEHLI